MSKTFPEKTHTKHKPDGEGSRFIKKSESVGAGHEDGGDRLGSFDWPDSESGEGIGNPPPAGKKHWLNE